MPNYDPFINKQAIQRGYWLAVHRLAIEKWTSIGLYTVIALSYLIFFIEFGLYLYRYGEWGKLVESSIKPQIQWSAVLPALAPQELEYGTPLILAHEDNKYDFIVEVVNPNEHWAVEDFTYQFQSGAQKFSELHSFILPHERKFLAELGVSSAEPIREISFTKSPYQWRKISRLPNFGWTFEGEPAFHPQQVLVAGNEQKIVPARVTWTVSNESTLNIRSVSWQVALYRGTTLESYTEYKRDKKFPFLDKQEFEIFLYDPLPSIDDVRVTPIVNIFDPDFLFTPSS